MNTPLISKILFLDEDFRPINIMAIMRYHATSHNDRRDSKNIMAVGVGAFNDGDLERIPCYWVPFDGVLGDCELSLKANNPNIEKLILGKFNFISCQDVEAKINSMASFLKFKNPIPSGLMCPNIDHTRPATVSLLGKSNQFDISDLMCSLRLGLNECNDALLELRHRWMEQRGQMEFITQTCNCVRNNTHVGMFTIGEDCPVEYTKARKYIFAPAYRLMSRRIHNTKGRIQMIERERSYILALMGDIMSSMWCMK